MEGKMARQRRLARSVSILIGLLPALGVTAQELRLGLEFQVNTHTPADQTYPAVARAAGGFVVVWSSYQDASQDGVFGRRFSNAGVALATEFQVNLTTFSDQNTVAVGSDTSGRFVVAWQSSFGDGGSGTGIFARRVSASGAPVGGEFQVNAYTPGFQTYAAIAPDGDGDFVIAWSSGGGQDGDGAGIFARRFSSAGVPLTGEIAINSYTLAEQFGPAVAGESDGDFVIAWASGNGQDGSGSGVFLRRFSSAGVGLATELQVTSHTIGTQTRPSIATDADGDFVVAWNGVSQDGSSYSAHARRFSSAGAPILGELQINAYTEGSQFGAQVASEADGDFVVAWGSHSQDGDVYGIFARRFNSAGAPQATEFQVNTRTVQSQYGAAVATTGGSFVVVWHSTAQDGDEEGIFAQRFALPIGLDIDGDGECDALTDGLLGLRYLFGFRGAVLVTGAVDVANCTRCDAASIEAYLAGLTG
jgi:hypothetical protein